MDDEQLAARLQAAVEAHADAVRKAAASYNAFRDAQESHRADRDAEREAAEALDELLTETIVGSLDLGLYEPVGSSAGERLAKRLSVARAIKVQRNASPKAQHDRHPRRD